MEQQQVVTRPSNGLAVAGFVCGLVGAVFGLVPALFIGAWILGILGVVFGAIGRKRAKRDGAAHGGLALTGLILGVVALVLGVVGVVIVNDAVNELDRCLQNIEAC